MKRHIAVLYLLFWGIFACGVWGLAATARIVDLEEMAGLSDRIFRGRCLSVRPADHPTGLAVVEYTFQVVEAIKGTREGEEIVFQQLGSSGIGRIGFSGLPSYVPHQDIVLFLHPDSRLGLTSPVGFSQGVFQLARSTSGEWLARNGLGNVNLVRQAESKLRSAGVEPKLLQELNRGGAVALRTLAQTVRTIDRFHRQHGKADR